MWKLMKMILKVLASHDQKLTHEELLQFQEERTPIHTEHHNERPRSEVIRELNMKHVSEIFATMHSAAAIEGKYGFNFERAHRFRGRFTDVLNTYK